LLPCSQLDHHTQTVETLYAVEMRDESAILRLVSDDGTNRLTRARLDGLTVAIERLAQRPPPCLVIAGNARFFSAGADLFEIADLHAGEALGFAQMGQRLMTLSPASPLPQLLRFTATAWAEDSIWRWLVRAGSPGLTPSSAIVARRSA